MLVALVRALPGVLVCWATVDQTLGRSYKMPRPMFGVDHVQFSGNEPMLYPRRTLAVPTPLVAAPRAELVRPLYAVTL